MNEKEKEKEKSDHAILVKFADNLNNGLDYNLKIVSAKGKKIWLTALEKLMNLNEYLLKEF